MKPFAFAVAVATLTASLILTPVSAASTPSGLYSGYCGDTYTVQPQDYLAKIASACGSSIADILTLNPEITNPNLIYPGQVLRLTGNAPDTYTTTYIPYQNPTAATTYSGSAQVSLSSIYAQAGNQVTVSVSGYPAYEPIDFRLGLQGETYQVVYDGTTDAYGNASQAITIPSYAQAGENWIVDVPTTGEKDVVDVTSHTIYITGYVSSTSSGYAQVNLSSTQVTAGSSVTVQVSGYPANADIDYRVGLRGEKYSLVYDGSIASDGTASATITIPSSATAGQYWVVEVVTTSQVNIVDLTSHTIYITS